MVKYCQIKSAQDSQMIYSLGSIETFMRMVESGCGVTFIPWMAAQQLSESQQELVRPFAIPMPTRHLVAATNKNFIRHTILQAIVDEIQASVPKSMLSLATSQVSVY
jgi:LysR family hydrogen peroxide-inducible transcriptional activator